MSDRTHTDSDEEQVVEPAETSAEEQAVSSEESDYKEKWQRAVADLENLRKRSDQERQSLAKYAAESLIEELLPVVDNFDRATAHVPEEQKGSPWVAGIQYIQKNLMDILERRGVTEIPAQPGNAFDPHRHEAIGTVETDEQPEDTIAEVKNKGYMLADRVLRPAMVTVNQKPAASHNHN